MKYLELNFKLPMPISNQIKTLDKPPFLYFPLINNQSYVALNEKIKIGTKVTQDTFSSVSGTVTKFFSLHNISYVEIENDFKEKNLFQPHTREKLTKKDLEEILKNYFHFDFNKKEILLLNCVDNEPTVYSEAFTFLKYREEFLSLLDSFNTYYPLQKIIIVLRENITENITQLLNMIGMYPNIILKIVPNYYLLGNSEVLLNYLGLKKEESIVIKASTFLSLEQLLKHNRFSSMHFVTISGDGVHPQVFNLKIGMKLRDILPYIKCEKKVVFIARSLMNGYVIQSADWVISQDIDAIFIMRPKKREKEKSCIYCGACIDICPSGLNPLKRGRKESGCIECGLCSYICPCHINLLKKEG